MGNSEIIKLLRVKKLEKRLAFFLKSFNRKIEKMCIISFGACNFKCPYCKRDGQFTDKTGNIIRALDITWGNLKRHIDKAIERGEKIRLSGGDPCMFTDISLEIAKYVYENYNQKISVAHNGSSPKFIEKLLPYLDYVAIDFKGGYYDSFAEKAGIPKENAKNMIDNTLKCQQLCSENGVLVDVRTCVFKHTTTQELKTIADNIIKNNNINNIFWTLRRYSPVIGCKFESPTINEIYKHVKEIKKTYPQLKIGFRNKWSAVGGFEIF